MKVYILSSIGTSRSELEKMASIPTRGKFISSCSNLKRNKTMPSVHFINDSVTTIPIFSCSRNEK
jgi:hypothetical protein